MQTTVILANGELRAPAAVRARAAAAELLLAADGGAEHCRALELLPHLIVGDLDSLSPATRAHFAARGTRFEIHPPRKDETDLELALRAAMRAGAQTVILLAALGGRWDQSLANLLLLTHPDFAALDLRLEEGPDTFWLVRRQTVVRGAPGDRLSLLPLTGEVTGVTLAGLEYPLTNGTLRCGQTLGLSNILTQPEAVIAVQSGILLVIHHQERNS